MTVRFKRLLLILVLMNLLLPISTLVAKEAVEGTPDIITYVYETGNESFEEKPYTAEDALVFARLSYVPFQLLAWDTAYSISSAYEYLSSLTFEEKVLIEWDDELLAACASSDRYKDVAVLDFISDTDLLTDKQFSAVTFTPDSDLYFVAFRGTDNTVVGWKEDFNMSFITPVPSQAESVRYLSSVMDEYPSGTFVLTGHSKGGNLAIYSASFVSEAKQDSILEVFSFDGPGFPDEVLEEDGYQRMRDRIRLYVPKSSVIGMLLSRDLSYTAVDSNALSGFRQHDIYTWMITEGAFVLAEGVDDQSRFFDRTIRSTLATLDDNEREELVDLIFSLAEDTGKSTFASMKEQFLRSALSIVKGFSELTENEQDVLFSGLKSLAENAFENLRILLPERRRK